MNEQARLAFLSLAMGAALTLASCASPHEPQVATAQQPSTSKASAGASPAPPDTDYDKALRFTRCMTENGAKTADPVVGEALVTGSVKTKSGLVSLDMSESAATREAKFRAFPLCQQFLPDTWPIKVDPKEIARSRKYNQCLKERGFPQPEPDGQGMVQLPLLGGTRSSTEWDAQTGGSTPEFEAAQEACRSLLPDAANGLSTQPGS